MENLNELEVIFNTSMSQVYLWSFREFKKMQLPSKLVMIVMTNESKENGHISQDGKKKKGKRKASDVDIPFSPKKKGRNPG